MYSEENLCETIIFRQRGGLQMLDLIIHLSLRICVLRILPSNSVGRKPLEKRSRSAVEPAEIHCAAALLERSATDRNLLF